MSIKTIFLSLTFVMASAVSFAGNEIVPSDTPPVALEVVACTLSASFSSGGSTVDVTVTASTCARAAATLGAIAEAIDQE